VLKVGPGDLIQVKPEHDIINKVSYETLVYYSKFYDNSLFEKHGIIIKKIKNNFLVYIQCGYYNLKNHDFLKIK